MVHVLQRWVSYWLRCRGFHFRIGPQASRTTGEVPKLSLSEQTVFFQSDTETHYDLPDALWQIILNNFFQPAMQLNIWEPVCCFPWAFCFIFLSLATVHIHRAVFLSRSIRIKEEKEPFSWWLVKWKDGRIESSLCRILIRVLVRPKSHNRIWDLWKKISLLPVHAVDSNVLNTAVSVRHYRTIDSPKTFIWQETDTCLYQKLRLD